MGGTVTLCGMIWARALIRVIALCSWARHLSLTVRHFTQVNGLLLAWEVVWKHDKKLEYSAMEILLAASFCEGGTLLQGLKTTAPLKSSLFPSELDLRGTCSY